MTRPDRPTLTDGRRTCRGLWKTIHESKLGLQRLEAGGIEFDFRDSWKSEVAAYALDKLVAKSQIDGLLDRRDAILALADARVAESGEAAVLYP